ncbi:GrpB family protein [Jiangella asiatica]|uniref:GrpB family protein n=1 Tax=Jiangella asiatica TaxID=2530372 RepID=A0A4R5CIY0_9ACTN|nr:GrpB family protein [Jiangella asiatica]TDD99086.1 GrpB family protein [Jiangella asiatica]
MTIEVHEYDEKWPALAAAAGDELRALLPGVFIELEHIGSTSVPGLAAKPIIDLMGSVRRLGDVSDRESALAGLGYEPFDTGMRERLFYFRAGADGRRTHHLHVVTVDTWDTRNERLLRDHLRAHPEAARRYADLKLRLAAETHDSDSYTRAKTALVQELVDAARTARGLSLECVWEE